MARSSSGNSLKIFRTKDDQFFDWETSVRIAYGLLKVNIAGQRNGNSFGS
jgi:hypothetical protein